MLFEPTLDLCGFERAEVRAHLASLNFEGYDWSFSNGQNLRLHHLPPLPDLDQGARMNPRHSRWIVILLALILVFMAMVVYAPQEQARIDQESALPCNINDMSGCPNGELP
jgi:cbb3-type cytochrome oxidase subunit 3